MTEEALNPEENFEFHVQMTILFGERLNSESLQRRGLIDPDFLKLQKSVFGTYLLMKRVRQYWKSYGQQFYAYDSILVNIVDQMIDQIEQLAK